MQGHHCIPANTARLAPRFWGRPIPRAKICLPAKPRRQNPPFFLRFGLNGRYRQTAKTADTGKLDEKPVDVEIAHNYKRGHVSVFRAIKNVGFRLPTGAGFGWTLCVMPAGASICKSNGGISPLFFTAYSCDVSSCGDIQGPIQTRNRIQTKFILAEMKSGGCVCPWHGPMTRFMGASMGQSPLRGLFGR